MSKRTQAALAALAVTLTPILVQAENRTEQAAQACAQALVAKLATPTTPAPKLVETRLRDQGPDQPFSDSPYELELTVVNLHTNRTVAQGTCAVSSSGAVLSIRARPPYSL